MPLRRLAECAGASQAQIIGQSLIRAGAQSLLFNHTTDQSPQVEADYFAIGADRPDVHWKAAMRSAPLEIVDDRRYAEIRTQRGTRDIFTEFLNDYRGFFGCHTTLIGDPDATFTLALLRTNEQGFTGADDLERFAAMVPYAHAAVLMQRALEHQGAMMAAGTLGAMRAAAFVLDRRGLVQAQTAAAAAAIGAEGSLTCAKGHLRALHPDEDRLLQKAVTGALAGMAADRIVLRDPNCAHLFRICEVFALPRREWSFGFEPRVIVVLRSQDNPVEPDLRLLMQHFGLSKAEAQVILLTANGIAREEIAQQRSTSVATVCQQLKSIFEKADVRREGALIALVNKLLR